MGSNINPTIGRIKDLSPFRYWCQKVIPLIYDDSLSYYELLSKFVDYINTNIENVEILQQDVTGLYDAFMELQNYVNDYFDNLDIDAEVAQGINHKLDEMASDGTLDAIIANTVAEITEPIVRENLDDSVSNKIDALVDDGVFRSYTSNIVGQWFADYANPVFVDDTSDMTDESKIYVLTTTGYIYAWSGSEFYNTGLQYQFDDSGYLKNAGVLGNNTNLNDVVEVNQCYYCSDTNTYENLPYGGTAGLLEVRYQGITTTQVFYGAGTGGVHLRRKTGDNAWTEWQGAGLSNNGVIPNNADLDNYTTSGYYMIASGNTYTHIPTNVDSGILCVFNIGTYVLQVILRTRGNNYARRKSVSTWDSWNIFNSNNQMLPYNTNLNNVMEDGYWYLNGVPAANYGNMPTSYPSGRAAFLEVYRYNTIVLQKLYGINGAWFARRTTNNGSTWTKWVLVSNVSGSSQPDTLEMVAYGDSLMMGSVWEQGDEGAVVHFASLPNQMSTKIAVACGMQNNFENLAESNIGYLPNASHPNETIGTCVRDTSMSGIGLVVLSGGRNDGTHSLGTANDASGSNTIMGAIKAIFEDIQNRNSKIQIVLVQATPYSSVNGEAVFTTPYSGGWSLDDFEVEAKKLCAKYGVGYVGWRECTYIWHWADYTGVDGNYAHPDNEESYAQMGAYLAGKVSQYYKY